MKTKQAPIHSGYGERTTAREAVGNRDLNGAIAIVTGGHAGIGIETTRALADAGATVIVGARTLDTARAALAGIARIELDTSISSTLRRSMRSPHASWRRAGRSTCS